MFKFFGGVTNAVIKGIAGNSEVAALGTMKLQVMTEMQKNGFHVNPVNFMRFLLGVNHKFRYGRSMLYFYTVPQSLQNIKKITPEESILERMDARGMSKDETYDPQMMKVFLSKAYEYLVARSMSNIRGLVIRDSGGNADVIRDAKEDLPKFLEKKYAVRDIKAALVKIFNKEEIIKYGFFKRMDIYKKGGSGYRNTAGNYYKSSEITDYILVTQKQEVGFQENFNIRNKAKAADAPTPIPTIMNVIPKSGFNKHNVESLRTVLYLIMNYEAMERKYGERHVDELIRSEFSILIPNDETVIRMPQAQK